eukprot:gene19227-21154_t
MTSYTSDAELSSSADQDEEPLAELTDEELHTLVEDTIRANEVLKIETKMFEKYLKRVDPKDVILQNISAQASHAPENVSRTFRKRSRSRGHSLDRHLKLSAEQKCDIATRELEELREEIERFKEDSDKVLDNYKAVMEEADIRFAELKKAQYEFNRDIVTGAVNPRTNKVIAEKLMRYLEDKLRSRDTLIEKLRLKNSTLKVQKKKLQLQLKQKEEMGEVLHEVDFNQLKIENSQYLEKIDERNQDLLRLKLMTGNVLQVLNSYKKKLYLLTLESDRLKSEITQRNDMLSRIEAETLVSEKDRSTAELTNRKLRQYNADYKVPDVMEYVKEKADLYKLRKSHAAPLKDCELCRTHTVHGTVNNAVSSWERKVEIADMALKTHTKTWQKMKSTAQEQQQNPWS